jgi:CubicO group peptidase (beta-lactamase class C family)
LTKLFTPLLLIACIATAAQTKITKLDGQTISHEQIDNIVLQLMKAGDVPGLNLAIINRNQVAYIKSYGFRNKEKAEYVDTSTTFSAASFSKAVFAYLVMQLVDEGKIDLDKPLYQYLDKPIPEYDNYKDLAGDERWKLITARHCLSHTTGFPNWRFLNPKGNRKLEIFFTPGARYAYSGEGLVLLQVVIEKITSTWLEELMKEKVFRPIGMVRTSYIWQPSFESNHATGYDGDGKPLERRKRYDANAAGSMETTISDFSRFVSAVLQGKGLSQKAKDEMFRQHVKINSVKQFPSLRADTTEENKKIQLSYGLGWGLLVSPHGKAFFKEGHDDGWEHYNIHFPDKKTGIIIMTNSSNGEGIFKELLERLVGDTFTPWQWENYIPYKPIAQLNSSTLGEYAGLFKNEMMEAKIYVEEGGLKLDAKEEGLSKVKLYAEKKDHFFMRSIGITIEFARDNSGKIEKMIADNGGEKYEFKKVN